MISPLLSSTIALLLQTPPPSTKRKLDARKSLSKSPEVEKKRSKKAIASSTRRALGGNVRPGSVLQYFRKVTKEEHDDDLEREADRDAVGKEARRMAEVQQTARNRAIKRDKATERKRKSRAGQKSQKIASGELNFDGTEKQRESG
ncbi:hypothetical protein BDZ89DRAFT_1040393 [Hymenopellis radicata]|nr:hypothetical protein BDZ89DRAFT_1040393 [Hymenopellis radicata]